MISHRSLAGSALASLLCLMAPPAMAQGLASLAAHRAVYNLELENASERSGITSMFGRMVYEFTGSECAGYKVNFRFVTQVDNGGEKKVTDQQSTTFEDVKSGRFEFDSRSYTDDHLDKEVTGTAKDSSKGISVDLTAPIGRQLQLAQSRFPTEHMLEVIRRALKGEHFFEARVFDGSDDADKSLFTSTVVGAPESTTQDGEDADRALQLKSEKMWPVTIAYFKDEASEDAVPVYRMSFKLYQNGVSRDLTMDYGDFVLRGKLVSLDMLPSGKCPAN
jgi:hypothetical protein